MRIIGGLWRSRVIPFPDLPGLRPTPDRVRETLFNWLGQDLTGWHCLDLYAGSGAATRSLWPTWPTWPTWHYARAPAFTVASLTASAGARNFIGGS